MLFRWVNDERQRYYIAQLQRDLFGDRVLSCCWGAIGSRRGGHRDWPVCTDGDAFKKLSEIAVIRTKHGYRAF